MKSMQFRSHVSGTFHAMTASSSDGSRTIGGEQVQLSLQKMRKRLLQLYGEISSDSSTYSCGCVRIYLRLQLLRAAGGIVQISGTLLPAGTVA